MLHILIHEGCTQPEVYEGKRARWGILLFGEQDVSCFDVIVDKTKLVDGL
jgi:hypothetical protein